MEQEYYSPLPVDVYNICAKEGHDYGDNQFKIKHYYPFILFIILITRNFDI